MQLCASRHHRGIGTFQLWHFTRRCHAKGSPSAVTANNRAKGVRLAKRAEQASAASTSVTTRRKMSTALTGVGGLIARPRAACYRRCLASHPAAHRTGRRLPFSKRTVERWHAASPERSPHRSPCETADPPWRAPMVRQSRSRRCLQTTARMRPSILRRYVRKHRWSTRGGSRQQNQQARLHAFVKARTPPALCPQPQCLLLPARVRQKLALSILSSSASATAA
jgi:hypothetical protein